MLKPLHKQVKPFLISILNQIINQFIPNQIIQYQINKNPNNSNFQKINSENMNDANHSYQEYNDLFQAHQQILIKHSKLEETLRNETINSELQRSI